MNDSLETKLGQMLLVGFRGADPAECAAFLEKIHRYHIGGVWLTDAESPMGRVPGNIRSPEQLTVLTTALQAAATIPLFISIDAEGGEVIRLKEQFGFPRFLSARALGDRDDAAFTHAEARRLATLLKDVGINFNLAPVVDIDSNPANPVIGNRGRALSADPHVVTRHADAFIRAHHEQGIACCLKHFPGHGSSSIDSHLDMVDVTQSWSPQELIPYRELISRGLVDAVLSAHVFVRHIDPAYPATLSDTIMTGLLRDELGFAGVILSDDMNMNAIAHHYSPDDATARAIAAGIDIIVHGNCTDYDERIIEHTIERLHRLLASGRLTEQRVNASFERILRLKRRYGMTSS